VRLRLSGSARWNVRAVIVVLAVLVIVIGGGTTARLLVDRRSFVTEQQLAAAMETFRPSERSGGAEAVDATTLSPERSTRADPGRCRPLALLTVGEVVDGRTWTGINGSPAQPVRTLTVRFAEAGTARAQLSRKRMALLRCDELAVTFPPFDEPAQTYTVEDRLRVTSLVGDRMSYTLRGSEDSYTFYVRQYANTLTWSYGDDSSTPAVRREVADALVARLREIAHE
jgi:hypothetical protein